MKFRTIIIIITIILLVVFFVPKIMGTTIGTVKKGDCINLYQVCENCTYNNISRILYPNKTIVTSNVTMNNGDDTFYYYNFCDTNDLGTYIVNGYGNLDGVKTTWVYDFEVTGTGFEFSQSRSIYFIAMLFILVIFFIGTIYLTFYLPSGNDTDDYGLIMGVNNLKYLKFALYGLAWGLLLAILFTSSNIALAYLGSEMFGDLLFALFKVMMVLSAPIVIVLTLFVFVNIFRDKETRRILERGAEVNSWV